MVTLSPWLLALALAAGVEPPATINPATQPSDAVDLGQAIARSLSNVQVVKADVAVRTAAVGRFEALKSFIPLSNMPQILIGFRRFNGTDTSNTIIFPDVTGGTPLAGQPRLDHAELNRMNLFFPLDPSGQITALPLAEEGIRAKEVMENLVRRSQAVLAAQRYFEAKQVPYGLITVTRGVAFARETLAQTERKLREKQAHDVEVTQAKVDLGRAEVLLADLEKDARVTQRRLGVVLHTSRLLIPQEAGPQTIEPTQAYAFDLADPDMVDFAVVPDFPRSRDEAIQMAKRQRLEVRLMQVGLRVARLQEQRDRVRLFGLGQLPLGLSFKNTSPGNGGIAFGAIFGHTYDLPLLDIGLWASVRRARIDVIRAQLDLENAVLEVAEDAGTSWDRWQQAEKEWQQKEAEFKLREEYKERLERLYIQKQAIPLEVLGTIVALLQADANRWTAWYNLQLSRLDVLRATELLLDFCEKAGFTPPVVENEPARKKSWKERLPWNVVAEGNP